MTDRRAWVQLGLALIGAGAVFGSVAGAMFGIAKGAIGCWCCEGCD